MNKEIERKFLLKDNFKISELKFLEKHEIIQGYLREDINLRVRINKKDSLKEESTLTYKVGTGLVRDEYEVEIPLKMAKELLSKSLYKIEKIRHLYIDKDKNLWELDYFPNKNLWLAEIELSSRNKKIELPDFIKKEVTGDKKYYNDYLAKN
jgi:adenylate cyclase